MPTAAARVPLKLPVRPDQVWTMDFTQDAFASGRKFRTLNLDTCQSPGRSLKHSSSMAVFLQSWQKNS